MPNNKNIHITYDADDGKWKGKREGASRSSAVGDTKADAIKKVTEIAKKHGDEVVIHKKDGVIQDRRSHGNDPKNRPG